MVASTWKDVASRPEQHTLLERLLALCPSAQCVAYEDPKLDEGGALRVKARDGYERLRAIVGAWKTSGEPAGPLTGVPAPDLQALPEVDAEAELLRSLLFDVNTRERFVRDGPSALPEALRPLVATTDRAQLASTARHMAADARTRQRTPGAVSMVPVSGVCP